MKKLLVSAVLATFCLILCSCGDSGSFLKGKWERVANYVKGQEVADERDISFTFDDDMMSTTKGNETQNYYFVYEDDIVYCLETKDDDIENAVGSFTIKEHTSDKLILIFNDKDGNAEDYGYVLKKVDD